MAALFVSNQSRSKNLVEFKAGKMTLEGQTVVPDKRKGLFFMTVGSDNLLRFKWKDRTTDVVEDDFILFPDEVEFVKVPQCTTGRVFLLRWKSHPRRLFFWMQDANADKDEAIFKKVNDLLKNPVPSSSSEENLHSLLDRVSFVSDRSELSNLLQSVAQQDFSSLISQIADGSVSFQNSRIRVIPRSSASAASTDTNITPVSTPAAEGSPHQQRRHQVKLHQLQDILSSYNIDAPSTARNGKQVNLANICNADAFNSLMSTDSEDCESLIAALPEGVPHNVEEVGKSVSCPQVKYTFRILSSAIRSGHFANAMVQFGLNSDDIISSLNAGNLDNFVQALEKFMKEHKDQKPEDAEMEAE